MWFSAPKWEESGMWALRFGSWRDKGNCLCATGTNSTANWKLLITGKAKARSRSVKLCVNGIFPVKSQYLPEDTAVQVFELLFSDIYRRDFTLEKSLWQQNHLPPRERCQRGGILKSGTFKGRIPTSLLPGIDSWVEVSSLRTQIISRMAFFPLCFEAKQLLFFFLRKKMC